MSRNDINALLQAINPVQADHSALDGRALDDLRTILAAPVSPLSPTADRPAPARPSRTWTSAHTRMGLVATAALVAVLAPTIGLPGRDSPAIGGGGTAAYAATPPVLEVRPLSELALQFPMATGQTDSASRVLLALAEQVRALPDEVGSGRYARVSTQSWSLSTRVDGEQVTSRVVPVRTTTWTASDGSGRSESAATGVATTDETYGTGQRLPFWPVGSLSADPVTLERQLEAAHPVENGSAERLVAIADLYREQPVPPQVRAAVLRYLAATPGLGLQGAVTDRAGRPGLVVYLDNELGGLPNRRSLILDPNTGALLGAETTLTDTAGRLNVPIPSVIEYTAYLSSRLSPTVDK